MRRGRSQAQLEEGDLGAVASASTRRWLCWSGTAAAGSGADGVVTALRSRRRRVVREKALLSAVVLRGDDQLLANFVKESIFFRPEAPVVFGCLEAKDDE